MELFTEVYGPHACGGMKLQYGNTLLPTCEDGLRTVSYASASQVRVILSLGLFGSCFYLVMDMQKQRPVLR